MPWFSEYMQRFVVPIRATVFGANVMPITRGVSGLGKPWSLNSRITSGSTGQTGHCAIRSKRGRAGTIKTLHEC